MELDDAVNLDQFQPMLDIEFEVVLVANVLGLVEKAGYDLHILLRKPL